MATYTDSMISRMTAMAPLNIDKAHALAGEFGVSYRSVIAKASQLGIDYTKKAPAAKREKGVTKLDAVNKLREYYGIPRKESANFTADEVVKMLDFHNLG